MACWPTETRKRAIFWSAIPVRSVSFESVAIPGSLVLGIVFAWWVIQTGSLLPAIAGHALNNFLALMVARYEIFGPLDDFNNLACLPWWLNVCGIVLAAVGLWWFNQMAKRGKASRSNRRLTESMSKGTAWYSISDVQCADA